MGNELRTNDAQGVKVTIIVACRNEIGHIREFLDSLLAQDMSGIPWEAIIADGISDDGTRAILDEYCARYPQLRAVSNPDRIVSTGLNAAIRTSRGQIIMRMDAHTSFAPDYCRLCLETLERTGADNVGGPARTKAVGSQARAVAAAYHSRFSTGGARFHDVNYEGWVDTVPYGCWRKSTIQRIGLFDETMVRNQDDELNLRLCRSGGRIWQNPAIVSWYSPRSTLSDLFRQYFQYGFWKVAVVRKHRLPGSWRHLVPVLFVLTNIFLVVAMVVTAVGASHWFNLTAELWLGLASTYTCACLLASLASAARHGWTTLPYLPAAFAAYHFSYGMGFFMGLLLSIRKTGATVCPSKHPAFTRITR
jgi:succinoglycan biosynthesis protein ExoA